MNIMTTYEVKLPLTPHGSNPESKAARMALLKIAVKKEAFTLQEVRDDVPHIEGEVVRRQVRRLEGEGLITRITKATYIATCVVHLLDREPEDRAQPVALERMPKDEVLAYLAVPRSVEDVQKHFSLSRDNARARLQEFMSESCVHRMKVCRTLLYAASKQSLQDALDAYEATRRGRESRSMTSDNFETADQTTGA